MNHPRHNPLSALADACSATMGRCLTFCLAVCLPYLVLGFCTGTGLAALPLIVLGSALTGWGLLVYPALFLGCFLYVRFEPSRWLLLLPLAISGLDLWRVSQAFAK